MNTEINIEEEQVSPYLISGAAKYPNYLLDNILMETKENMDAWRKVKRVISKIKSISDEKNARLMVVIFPRSIQINNSKFEFFRRVGYNIDDRTLSSRKPQDLMLQLCNELSIECLDLLPYLRSKIKSGEKLYRIKDDHLNNIGDQVSADLIYNLLIQNIESDSS